MRKATEGSRAWSLEWYSNACSTVVMAGTRLGCAVLVILLQFSHEY
jgi:hypothetical protein